MRGAGASTIITALAVAWLAGILEARAVCNSDAGEPDDICVASLGVLHGGQTVGRSFCDDASDWTRLNACAGRTYTIRTLNLGAQADTVVELYGPDCATLLASDDNGGGGRASMLTWTAPADGVFHLKVRQA